VSITVVTWLQGSAERSASWLGVSSPPPRQVGVADDRTTAAAALARARSGEALVYTGDFRNARQLLAAMSRRLEGRRPTGRDPASLWRSEREHRRREHDLLGRIVVPFEEGFRLPLGHAPDVSAAVAEALGPEVPVPGLLPLRDLLGMVGAHEWRRKGVAVPALGARVHPHYGVYAPVRGEYVDLVAEAVRAWPVEGKRALDAGTGTGVLAFVLARAGAHVVATDIEPRAVACARDNASRLGLGDRVEILEADLFPADPPSFDLVVSNPPWLPDVARSPLERAVYDPEGSFLERLLATAPARLAPGGEAWIVISNLAELLGLRPTGAIENLARRAGLRIADVRETRPSHPRAADSRDPLHRFRAAERTRLVRLIPEGARSPGDATSGSR
jgi:methylase of polypeptide subunit release factors